MSNGVHSIKFYVWVFVALMALTILTVAAARLDLGGLHGPVAMLIAGTKAAVVGLFFMHLRWSGYRTRVVALSGIAWLVILFAFIAADVFTRHIPEDPPGWKNTVDDAFPRD